MRKHSDGTQISGGGRLQPQAVVRSFINEAPVSKTATTLSVDASVVCNTQKRKEPVSDGDSGIEGSVRFAGLTRVACLTFCVSMVLAVLSARCLYGDGAHEFIRVLQTGTFVELMWVRGFAFDVYESFLVLAIRLGVTDMHYLRLAFGLGCFLPWPIALWICHLISPKHFWLAMLGCAGGYLNAAFMPVGEHILAHALVWVAVFALLFVRPLTVFSACVLLGSAAILCRCYESLVFLGPALALLAFWRAVRGGENLWRRLVLFLTTTLFLVAASIALNGVLFPEMPENFGGFRRGVFQQLLSPSWTVAWSGMWVLLMIAVAGSRAIRKHIAHPVALWILCVSLCVWGFWPIIAPAQLNVVAQHHSRFLDLLVPLALLPIAVGLSVRPDWLAKQRPYFVRLSAAMLLAQSVWQIGATWHWHGYVNTSRGLLASRSGPFTLAATPFGLDALDGQALRFDWYWANPCFSLAMAPNGKVRSIIVPRSEPVWQPFNPLNPRELPDLSRYGVDYGRYITALAPSVTQKEASNL